MKRQVGKPRQGGKKKLKWIVKNGIRYSPWFPRESGSLVGDIEVVRVSKAGTVSIKLFTTQTRKRRKSGQG